MVIKLTCLSARIPRRVGDPAADPGPRPGPPRPPRAARLHVLPHHALRPAARRRQGLRRVRAAPRAALPGTPPPRARRPSPPGRSTAPAAEVTPCRSTTATGPAATRHPFVGPAPRRRRSRVPTPARAPLAPGRAQGAPPAPRRWSSTRTLSGTRRPRSGAGTASRARRSTAPTGERLPAAARPWATPSRAQPPRERGARRRWGERPAACRVWSCERRHHTRKIKVASDGERRVGVGGRACTNCCRQE